jgi:hypothetical protein
MQINLITALVIAAAASPLGWTGAAAQTATLPISPDKSPPPDVVYPDGVTCDVTSTAGIAYRIVFYKGQTVSFGSEFNNVAEYGTSFERQPDKADAPAGFVWRLQLGKPGNITAFDLPAGWKSDDCAVGKAIKDLIADRQALKMFAPMTLDR